MHWNGRRGYIYRTGRTGLYIYRTGRRGLYILDWQEGIYILDWQEGFHSILAKVMMWLKRVVDTRVFTFGVQHAMHTCHIVTVSVCFCLWFSTAPSLSRHTPGVSQERAQPSTLPWGLCFLPGARPTWSQAYLEPGLRRRIAEG